MSSPAGRRAAAILTLLCLAPVSGCGDPEPTEPVPSRKDLLGAASGWNVVLISVDTLRADHLNSWGYDVRDTSPRIDELVRSGTRFASATAPRAATWPSLATVLTGLYPSGHGVWENRREFPDDLPTLPRILQARGYRTAAFLSNMCKANHSGWDERQCSRNASDENLLDNVSAWFEAREAQGGRGGATASEPEPQAAGGSDPGGSSLGPADAPVFLWAHFFGAHGPYYNGGDLAQRWDPDYDGIVASRQGVLNRIMAEEIPLDDRDVAHLEALYDAAVLGTDARIGRLLETVRRHLDPERTLFVFLADHGEELYQHNGYLYHACSVYESTLHVPLAFVAPGLLETDAAVAPPVELADVLPTLLDLLGVEQPDCVHGTSLVPYLFRPDREGPGKPALSEYGDLPIGTIRLGDWKLIDNPAGHRQVCVPDTDEDFYVIGPLELYHLADDPAEQTNLAASEPERVESLRRARAQRIQGLCSAGVTFDVEGLSPEAIEEMRRLGYVVGG